jgi:hypothetical protein
VKIINRPGLVTWQQRMAFDYVRTAVEKKRTTILQHHEQLLQTKQPPLQEISWDEKWIETVLHGATNAHNATSAVATEFGQRIHQVGVWQW